MSLDVDKNKPALVAAWKSVLDDKDPTNWALFGYEGQTNALKFISKGDGGLEELVEDFSSGSIMYAFCRVMDPKTSLPKFVIVNWQGEGTPAMRKGVCANHIPHVAAFFRGSHLSVTARTEDDVDPDVIIEKVAKSTGSAYQFSAPKMDSDPAANEKVGSAYKRIIPTRDINKSERDKFWEQQEAEEKRRLEEEQRKREAELKRLEEERSRREAAESKAREERVRERVRAIKQIKEAEAGKDSSVKAAEKAAWEKRQEQDARDAEDSHRRSMVERNQRAQEAKQLVGRRVSSSKLIFEQNSSAGQMNSMKPTNGVEHQSHAHGHGQGQRQGQGQGQVHRGGSPVDRGPSSIAAARTPSPSVPSAAAAPSPPKIDRDVHIERTPSVEPQQPKFDPIPTPVPLPEPEVDVHLNQNGNNGWDDEPAPVEEVVESEFISAPAEFQGGVEIPGLVPQNGKRTFEEQYELTAGQGTRARTLYDYQAADDTEISFDPDEIICRIDQIDEGWWQGLGPNGDYGLFPANYVQLLDE